MVYELRKNTVAIDKKEDIKPGCTLNIDERFALSPRVLKTFDKKENALDALKDFKSTFYERDSDGRYYEVTEYYVEENEYDDEGEWISGRDIWEFADFLPEKDYIEI